MSTAYSLSPCIYKLLLSTYIYIELMQSFYAVLDSAFLSVQWVGNSAIVCSLLLYLDDGHLLITKLCRTLDMRSVNYVLITHRCCSWFVLVINYLRRKTINHRFYRCTMHSDIHTVHSPTDAHLLTLWLQFTIKLDGSHMFQSTTIIRELAIEPG